MSIAIQNAPENRRLLEEKPMLKNIVFFVLLFVAIMYELEISSHDTSNPLKESPSSYGLS